MKYKLAFLLLLIASVARADSTANWLYTFTGDTFTYATGVYAPGDRVTGSFILSGSFIPECCAYEQTVASGILRYRFTDGHQVLTQHNSTISFFNLGVDGPNGDIPLNPSPPNDNPQNGIRNDWDIRVGTPTSFIWTGDVDGDYATVASIGDSVAAIQSFNGHLYPGDPGTWTVEKVHGLGLGPERVPEPSSLVLLAVGLLGGFAVVVKLKQ